MSVFAEMREDLEKHGWYQGGLYAPYEINAELFASITRLPQTAACLQGAFNRCTANRMTYGRPAEGLLTAIAALYPDWHHDHKSVPELGGYDAGCYDWCVIIHFNDDKSVTYEDIMLVLKYAEAEDAISGGQG
jgi:hypothetical protein